MNIVKAKRHPELFKPYFGDLKSFNNWDVCLRVIYGLPVTKFRNLELIRRCTGRDPAKLSPTGYDTVLLLVGRRGGKSKNCGLIAAYESCIGGGEKVLSPGELGLISIVSPTKLQSQIDKSYIRAALSTPTLEQMIAQEDREGFELSNKVRIQILTGDFRSVRGFSQLMVIVDEICFFQVSEECRIRSDTELVRAIRPSLATTGGKLVAVSTKYAKRGWAYRTWKKCFGNNNGKTLVWDASSRTMNPTLPQSVIDIALEEDLQAAKSEYLGEWREDVILWLPREVIEMVVHKGRKELLPQHGLRYFGFCDVSGGRSEGAGLAIAHRAERKVVIDFARQYKAPHSPVRIVGLMCDELRRFHLSRITGDNYSAQFVADCFASHGIKYKKSELPKSGLYLELLPRICSGAIELLDDEVSIDQLAGLERRTRSGGKDKVDHPTGAKDDLSNAIAGVATVASKKVIRVGGGIHK